MQFTSFPTNDENKKEEKNDDDNALFFVDTAGNPQQSQFERVYKYDVPKYTVSGGSKRQPTGNVSAEKPDQGKQRKLEQSDESELIDTETLEAPPDTELQALFAQRPKIQERIDADPTNEEAWLDIIELQKNIDKHLGAVSIDTIISVLKKALDSIPSSHRLVRMYMDAKSYKHTRRYLSEGGGDDGNIGGLGGISTEWREYVLQHPDQSDFWVDYVKSLVDGAPSYYGVMDVLDKIVRTEGVFDMLGAMIRRRTAESSSSSSSSSSVERSYVGALVYVCRFLKEAGYIRLAVGIIQAVLEYTVVGSGGYSGVAAEFEQFWKSGTPRIGDAGRTDETDYYLPLTATVVSQNEETDDSVLFDIALFSDVEPFLVPVKSVTARTCLVWTFINLLDLPVPWTKQDYSVLLLLDEYDKDASAVKKKKESHAIVQAVLNSLVKSKVVLEPDFWRWAIEYMFADNSAKSGAKFAKKVLQNDKENILLWAYYAAAETSQGNPQTGCSVFDGAFHLAEMNRQTLSSSLENLVSLWVIWLHSQICVLRVPKSECLQKWKDSHSKFIPKDLIFKESEECTVYSLAKFLFLYIEGQTVDAEMMYHLYLMIDDGKDDSQMLYIRLACDVLWHGYLNEDRAHVEVKPALVRDFLDKCVQTYDDVYIDDIDQKFQTKYGRSLIPRKHTTLSSLILQCRRDKGSMNLNGLENLDNSSMSDTAKVWQFFAGDSITLLREAFAHCPWSSSLVAKLLANDSLTDTERTQLHAIVKEKQLHVNDDEKKLTN